jgi:nicotinamide-nucleotide amidase
VTLNQTLGGYGLYLATAESLTAGLIASELANNPGASKYLLGGIVCYQNEIKIKQLGVDPGLIDSRGPVDPAVALQMAYTVRSKFALDCDKPLEKVIGVSTTGVAGPDSLGDKPVGLVYLGISSSIGDRTVELRLNGSRSEVRLATVAKTMEEIADEIHRLIG